MTSLVPPHWLVAQRWYGAADRRLVGLSDVDSAALGPSLQGGELTWLLVEASFESGDPAHFQIVWDAVAGRDRADDPAVLRFAFPGLDFDSVELLAGEQSNTSLVVRTPSGDLVAKLFRRPPPGPNPDAEVVRALWDVGFRQLPEPVGEFRRSGRDLAVIRRRVPGAIDGWAMALEDPDAMLRGADELGRLTAQMHVALAAAFGSRRVSGQGWAVLHRALVDELSAGGALDAAQARRLVRPADALAGLADAGSAIRVHGDLHLGQVLRSEGRWYVLDFEGEPARPLEARRERSSALRDVAGMLRSFDYAAAVGGHGSEWRDRAVAAYLAGYRSVPAAAELAPSEPAWSTVLDAFVTDKALYELAYERANRPEWEWVPRSALARLAGES